jgi:hypothetical protein
MKGCSNSTASSSNPSSFRSGPSRRRSPPSRSTASACGCWTVASPGRRAGKRRHDYAAMGLWPGRRGLRRVRLAGAARCGNPGGSGMARSGG